MSPKITVGIADLKTGKNPASFITIGLGSCVGIVLYDPIVKVGALIHIMLPTLAEGKSPENKAKYADSAIPAAIEEMKSLGGIKGRMWARISGGARMFSFKSTQEFIGDRNIESVKKTLDGLGIKIMAEDVGGSVGRTMEFDTGTGKVTVKTATKGIIEL